MTCYGCDMFRERKAQFWDDPEGQFLAGKTSCQGVPFILKKILYDINH
jgi:hypothetical protein